MPVFHTLRLTVLYGLAWCTLPTWTGDTEALQCGLKQPHGPVLEAALFPCYFGHGVIFYSFAFSIILTHIPLFWWLFGFLWIWHGSVRPLVTGPSCIWYSRYICKDVKIRVSDGGEMSDCDSQWWRGNVGLWQWYGIILFVDDGTVYGGWWGWPGPWPSTWGTSGG